MIHCSKNAFNLSLVLGYYLSLDLLLLILELNVYWFQDSLKSYLTYIITES